MADEEIVGSKQKEILGHAVSMATSTSKDHPVDRCSSNWSDLPPEILSLILSNLFLEDSSNFSATCRSWQSITPPFPPPTNSALSKTPYLMIFNNGGDGCKFFQPLRNETYHDQKINDLIFYEDLLRNATIRCSKYSWLLMSEGESRMFFFNPFTEVIIELPDLPWLEVFFNVSFSSPPTSSDCLVIGTLGSYLDIEFCIIRRGEDNWTTIHKFQNNQSFLIYDACPPVLYNGKLYCLGDSGKVGVLDLSSLSSTNTTSREINNDGLSWSIIRSSRPASSWSRFKYNRQTSFMVDYDGGMLVVFVTHEERRVHLKKLNVPEMVWQDVQSLRDKMLYLSHEASLVLKAVDERMANKIYFPKFHGGNGVFYSLDTGKYHSVVGNFSSTSCFNLAEQHSSYCTWIEAIYDDDYTRAGFLEDYIW